MKETAQRVALSTLVVIAIIAAPLLPRPKRKKLCDTWELIDLELGAFVRGQYLIVPRVLGDVDPTEEDVPSVLFPRSAET
jgi:hypothetical protein